MDARIAAKGSPGMFVGTAQPDATNDRDMSDSLAPARGRLWKVQTRNGSQIFGTQRGRSLHHRAKFNLLKKYNMLSSTAHLSPSTRTATTSCPSTSSSPASVKVRQKGQHLLTPRRHPIASWSR